MTSMETQETLEQLEMDKGAQILEESWIIRIIETGGLPVLSKI